ncbi:TonB-dependent receptor [Parvularcula marina]|uniref:Cell envelope biogenesis protein OmpA n=1 Tax=Parvularcula marina TaxID=2292771 RepID=A0A371RHI5_9PROT|nr:TonB-dependent receptor [Parvularcula marina]RFB04901.1 cell envelope biogenesis protein OmpA [Parvularcula marina]
MSFKSTLAAGAAAFALIGGFAAAQETTGAIRGTVTDEAGAPISGATVVISDAETGYRRSVTTGASGEFTFRSLSVGGTYSVAVTSSGYQGERVEDLSVSLGDTTSLSFDLSSSTGGDTIVVVATRQAVGADLAAGPSAAFGLDTLETAPAINRNLTDILRLDPRVYVDESRGDINAVQCGGKNSRFNSLTVDGVRMNDNFGLNANGYPTERIPFSYDAIEQVAVELAPFDVQYGGFSACNINAVTKSGTNDFHGYIFGDYTNDGLRADSLEGDDIESGEYDEYRYGIGIGGPIIQDKLFFFAAYEKLDGVNLFDRGPIGSGAVNEVNITQAEIDEILRISRDIYGYDPGVIPSSFDNEDEKILIKLDWNVTDNHRASFTYNWNDGFNIVESDGDLNELEFSNHLYERGSELTSYVGSLYSDWTENFSTEIRVGYSELDNRQISVGGTDFGEITIETDDVHVYLGGDDSRQANKLKYDTFNLALKGFYDAGNHNFSFGYEIESLEVFNVFVQHVETEIDFDAFSGAMLPGIFDPAIENFELGLADNINYNNAPSGDPADAAADWGYSINTVYFQDEYDFGNGFVVIGGLRYDWYTTDDAPETNPDFLADYGFSNGQTLDGEGLLQPRLGFTWDMTSNVDLRGGVGLYSGGNPNVWLSNTYSANNVLQFGADGGSFGLEQNGGPSIFTIPYGMCEAGVPTGPGYCVPQAMIDAVAAGAGSNFEINYLDPDFELPSEWKFALGGTFLVDAPALGGEYVLSADALFTMSVDSAVWIRGDLEQTGTTTGPDGREYPTYSSTREAAFVLTNSDDDADSLLLSGSIAKDYDFGLDWSLGYAYSDAEDVHPMTSSVAFSNYVNRAFGDPQDVSSAISDYNTKHRFTGLVNYEKAFFGENLTQFSAFGQVSSGRPYSLTIDVDPNSISGFNPFLEGRPYLAAGAERNGEEGSWWGKIDVKVEQEFNVFEDHKASAFIVIDNFTNLLNDEWGILREPGFPSICAVDASGVPSTPCESRQGDASRYEIRFGARYEF